jgi:hypothetical protein
VTSVQSEEVTRRETTQSVLLWLGILAAPLAWTTLVLIAPDIAEITCYDGARGSGRGRVWGIELETFLFALVILLTVVALAGGVVSLLCWLRLRRQDDSTPARRASWMALAGVLVSALFAISTVIGLIPLAFLESCAGTL